MMLTHRLLLWLSVGWLVIWFSEAVIPKNTVSICDLGPCRCSRGKLECDCSASAIQEVTLTDNILDIYSFSSIRITNCSHVHVASKALSNLPALQQVSIVNIARLTLKEKSFSWTTESTQQSGLMIDISNCDIPEIPSYCFRGFLRDIFLTEVNVSHVQPYAFGSINHADKVEFTKVRFKRIASQSFKKFGVDFLTFRETHMDLLPERALMDVEVFQEVRLDKAKIGRIETDAIRINGPRNVKIHKSKIDHVESKAFHVHTKGDVSIHDNTFSLLEEDAFLGFNVVGKYLQEDGKQDLIFENNTLEDFENAPLTLNTTGFNPTLKWIMIKEQCSCLNAQIWANELVFFCTNQTSRIPAPQVNSEIYCLNPQQTLLKDYQKQECYVIKSSLFMKILVGISVILVFSVVGILICLRVRKKGKRYINVPTSPSALKPAESHKPHMLVVPEGKTYRETELHVIVEHAEPIIPTEFVKERPDSMDA